MGQQPIGAFMIVINSENQVLLGERKNSYGVGLYGCPGGRLELSESLRDCAKRELLEETGLRAKSIKYLGVIRELQEGYNFIHFAFLCDEYEGQIELKEPDKCMSWSFYQLDSIPDRILPAHRAGLGYLIDSTITFADILS